MRRGAAGLLQQLRVGAAARQSAQLGAGPWHGCGGLGSGVARAVAQGVKDVDPKTLAKARRLALGIGTAAGAFGSLVGVGGGVLIVPAIVNACPSIPQRVISGTSLAAVVATGTTAGLVYLQSGLVDPASAALIAGSAVLTAPLGARFTQRLNCQALRRALGWWLFFVAPLVPAKALLFADKAGEPGGQSAGSPKAAASSSSASAGGGGGGSGDGGLGGSAVAAGAAEAPQPHPAQAALPPSAPTRQPLLRPLQPSDALIVATGCLAGFASGLLGIGGGTVVTPLLAVATGMPQTMVLGTSLVAMIPPSLVGLAQHARLGNVDALLAAALAAGTAAGGAIGSHLAIAAPPGVLEGVFAVGMVFLGRKTLQSASKAAAAAKATPVAVAGKAAPAAAAKK